MEYRTLGASGLKVSTLCLGAMTFGEADAKSMMHEVGCDEPTAFAILDRARERGINFIDTADVYGQDGLSERVLAKWLARDGHRAEVVLATKFRFRMADGPNGSGASRYRIVRAVEASLRRLGTDRIDLYQIHMQDLDTPEEETVRALDDLVRAGKVLYLGASNYAAYRLVDSLWTSRSSGRERFISLQAQYSLLERGVEREHVPACRRFGVGILPWSPLGGGFLSGKYDRNAPPPAGARLTKWKERLSGFDSARNWKILDALRSVAAENGRTPTEVALAWLLAKPAVVSVVFGVRSVEQLEANLGAADLKLGAESMKVLDGASAPDLGYPYDFMQRVQGSVVTVALVTGGGKGIGRGVALELAGRGVDVAICYRTSAGVAEETVATLQALGVRALALQADVGRPEEAERFVARAAAELGPPEILVHAAGPYQRGDVLAETPEGWRAMQAGNLDSLFYCARLVAPAMIAAKKGRIVAFGMANADRATAFPGVAAHYVAKVGVLALVRQLARALAPHGVTANAVSPGYIDSGSTTDETRAAVPKIPAGRAGTVDDVVAATMFLLGDEAAYVNGANLIVSGGWGI